MKKLLISIIALLSSVSYLHAWSANEPSTVIGLHKGQIKQFKVISITSSTHIVLISTGTEFPVPLTDWLIKNDEDNTSNIYLSTSPKFVSTVPLHTSSNNVVFVHAITTTTLIAATSVWTTGIDYRNLYTNASAVVEFGKWNSTAVVKGTVTIEGIDDSGGRAVERLTTLSTTLVNGSKIWVDISTISVVLSTDTAVGDINAGAVQNPAIIKVGAGSNLSTASGVAGNVYILHVGESVSVGAQVREGIPIFGRVIEKGSRGKICIIETEHSH